MVPTPSQARSGTIKQLNFTIAGRGGTGRRACLRNTWSNPCGFESRCPDQRKNDDSRPYGVFFHTRNRPARVKTNACMGRKGAIEMAEEAPFHASTKTPEGIVGKYP